MSSAPSHNRDTSNLHVVTENGEQCFIWRSNQLTYIAQDRTELPHVLAHKFGPLATKLDLSYNTLTSFRNINLFTNVSELILDNNSFDDDQLDFKENLRLKTLSLNKNKLTNLYKLITAIKVCFPNLEFLSLIGNPLCSSAIFQSLGEALNNTATAARRKLAFAPSPDGARQIVTIASTTITVATTTTILPTSANDLCNSSSGDFAAQMIDDQHADFVYQKYRYFIIYHLPNLRFLDSSQISERERDEALKRCYWMEGSSGSGGNNNNLNVKPLQDGRQTALGSQFKSTLNNNNNDPNSNSNGNQQEAERDYRLTIVSDYVDACQHPSTANSSTVRPRASVAAREATAPATTGTTGESLQPRGAFSRLSYLYTGKNSEGNRFIRNQDL